MHECVSEKMLGRECWQRCERVARDRRKREERQTRFRSRRRRTREKSRLRKVRKGTRRASSMCEAGEPRADEPTVCVCV